MVAVLLLGGFFRSLQFTSVNAIAFAEIEPARMSRATALVAVAPATVAIGRRRRRCAGARDGAALQRQHDAHRRRFSAGLPGGRPDCRQARWCCSRCCRPMPAPTWRPDSQAAADGEDRAEGGVTVRTNSNSRSKEDGTGSREQCCAQQSLHLALAAAMLFGLAATSDERRGDQGHRLAGDARALYDAGAGFERTTGNKVTTYGAASPKLPGGSPMAKSPIS